MQPAVFNERLSENRFLPRWVRHEHQGRYAFAARRVDGKTVVDCACGEGAGSEIFLKAGARRLYGFDASSEAVEAARARCPEEAARFQKIDLDKEPFPFPDRSVEVFVCLETIEHLRQVRAFLIEAARILQPDGVFICSTPNRTVTNPGASLRDKPWNRFHTREYSRQEFLDLLGSAFKKVDLFGQNPQALLKVRLMRGLGRVLPLHGAVRVSQALKFPALFLDRAGDHNVDPWQPGTEPEYLVAVCRGPKP